jgi:hypothetical protein
LGQVLELLLGQRVLFLRALRVFLLVWAQELLSLLGQQVSFLLVLCRWLGA